MFYGLTPAQEARLKEALGVIQGIYGRWFAADMMITLAKRMGFLEDAAFKAAFDAQAQDDQEKSLVWRLHVLCWCAESALRLPGDFVECGVFRGFSTAVAAQYLSFEKQDRQWLLFDTFSGIPPEMLDPRVPSPPSFEEPGLHEGVVERFRRYPNIRVLKGRVPDVLAGNTPARIAFLHLDMNSAAAESSALEALYDKLVPGAFVLMDDYGWSVHRKQKDAEDAFFARRGIRILELPTGQGLAIKPPA
jgi:O-methyltransferase